MMIFLDEDRRAIRCTVDFAQFNAFIANLNAPPPRWHAAATSLATNSRRAAAP